MEIERKRAETARTVFDKRSEKPFKLSTLSESQRTVCSKRQTTTTK